MIERENYRKSSTLKACIALAAVMLLSAAIFFVNHNFAFAVDEDDVVNSTEATDGYEPSEYRLANDAINEWEDRVLKEATGKLENEGRVYYAYGDYVNELISYFTKDGLELTEKDAKDAIAEIKDPENARAGALSGYLYQIGGKPKDSDSLVDNGEYDGEVYPEFDENVRFANEEEYRKSDLYLKNKAYIEERTNTVYESQAAMRKEMRELAEADRTYRKILSEKPSNASVTKAAVPKAIGISFVIVSALLLVFTIALILYGWRNNTVSILAGPDDERWNRGNSHKDRHRIRKISAIALAVVVAINLSAIYTGLTYYSTLGSNKYMEDSLDKGGICQHSFMQFRDDVHGFLSSNSLPQNALDRALTYRDYRFDYIKGVRSAIKNGSSEVAYRGVQEQTEAQIDLLAYVTRKDSRDVVSGINEMYIDSLSAEIGVFIHDIRASINRPVTVGFILNTICLLLAALMLAFERHNVYRGIRDLAIGALAGTVIWAAVTAAAVMIRNSGTLAVADDQTFVMLNMAENGFTSFMLILLGISTAVSAILFGASWFMERNS